ncbi:dormancy-associated protein homolog 3 isoform X3 [Sesamum indicum]|uniref:Dormancy-associated protein homolog 3 isoform X3 n=1 Tax=Sesamum indicum TaxID=4182 RepID=A0A6I9TXP8_SESIN|nr:dormancy-associated protein homolog 3 isoform X3 [Sesamum indicum]
MGLLDQLWDDTVAGPRPDSGLGKLRKHSTFSFRSNSGKESEVADNRKSFAEAAAEEAVRVTRSIMIVKPPQAAAKDSPPASPAGSTPPVSPFAGFRTLFLKACLWTIFN